ncbi:MAG: LytR/AlgR family response regulator transcription factor, partial [Faecalibacillus sp.]
FAEYLRKHDQHIDIVFQSHCSSYGVKSYRIRTLDYLIKPVNEKDIFRLLDTVLLKQQERFIIYKYRRKIKKIRLSDIIYLKIDKHCCSLYCLDGIEKVTCSLKTMKQYLDHHFVQCYRSYIVNIDYIEKIEDERLFLFHQQIVPVSKTYLPLLNETLWKQR